MTQDFSSAKVGDKVWSIQEGATTIVRIDDDDYPICTAEDSFDLQGKLLHSAEAPSLFWSNPHIIAPEKPKRKVEYKRELFANIYGKGQLAQEFYIHNSKGKAQRDLNHCVDILAACVPVTITYTLEE